MSIRNTISIGRASFALASAPTLSENGWYSLGKYLTTTRAFSCPSATSRIFASTESTYGRPIIVAAGGDAIHVRFKLNFYNSSAGATTVGVAVLIAEWAKSTYAGQTDVDTLCNQASYTKNWFATAEYPTNVNGAEYTTYVDCEQRSLDPSARPYLLVFPMYYQLTTTGHYNTYGDTNYSEHMAEGGDKVVTTYTVGTSLDIGFESY